MTKFFCLRSRFVWAIGLKTGKRKPTRKRSDAFSLPFHQLLKTLPTRDDCLLTPPHTITMASVTEMKTMKVKKEKKDKKDKKDKTAARTTRKRRRRRRRLPQRQPPQPPPYNRRNRMSRTRMSRSARLPPPRTSAWTTSLLLRS